MENERETERQRDRESKKEKLNHMMEVKKKHGWVRIQMKKKGMRMYMRYEFGNGCKKIQY